MQVLQLVLGGVAVGAGLKLSTFLGSHVFFPVFPNILDCVGLIAAGAFLWFNSFTKFKSRNSSKVHQH